MSEPRALTNDEEMRFREGLRDLPDMASAEALSLLEVTRREWMLRCASLLATLDAERAARTTPADDLDVERLARALHVIIEAAPLAFEDCPQTLSGWHCRSAETIARGYAALRLQTPIKT